MDFLLLHPTLVGRLKATAVDSEYRGRDKPSDHAPVWIELEPEPPAGKAPSPA